MWEEIIVIKTNNVDSHHNQKCIHQKISWECPCFMSFSYFLPHTLQFVPQGSWLHYRVSWSLVHYILVNPAKVLSPLVSKISYSCWASSEICPSLLYYNKTIWIEFIIRNYFMVRVNIPYTQYSSGSTPLLIFFILSTCPTPIYLSKFIPFSILCAIDSSITQAIIPTKLPSRFPFFSKYICTTCFICYWFWNCLSTLYWEFGLDTSQR